MQDYGQACAAMCIEVVPHTACFEMYVTRVDTYFITRLCISLTACMDGFGDALNEEETQGVFVNALRIYLTKGLPHIVFHFSISNV